MIRGRALMTLNKKQEKYLFVGTSIYVLLVLIVVVFICPNFYMQYRVVLHPEPIIDVTDDEREIIKNNIDFELPDTAVIHRISKSAAIMEVGFFMIFSVPTAKEEGFVESILNTYKLSDGLDYHSITISDKEYLPVQYYEHKYASPNYAAIYKYEVNDDQSYFQLLYTDAPSAIEEIFYERVRIMPKWLDFH